MRLNHKIKSTFLLFSVLLPVLVFSKSNKPPQSDRAFVCGTSASREIDALAREVYHESRLRQRPVRQLLAQDQVEASRIDVGDVAVIEDDGTLIPDPNPFNLAGKSFRFVPSDAASYRVEATSSVFDGSSGTTVLLDDDSTSTQSLGFSFTFYGRDYTSVQLNSDGNITFNVPDTESTDRDLGRFSSGPPRIGPLFADLDPSAAGSVLVRRDSDGVAFIWAGVPNFGFPQTNAFSVKLFQNGGIEFIYGSVGSEEAIVGISPGSNQGGITGLDYSSGLPIPATAGTLAEVFITVPQLSETRIAQKFFETHPDAFDHLNLFLGFDYDLGGGAFAYELPVKNEVRGIGLGIVDHSSFYGSNGRLRSFLNMGALSGTGRYPDNPNQRFLGTNSTLGVMGQESGHRWLAFTRFRDGNTNSKTILGRDDAHWSFFFDSDGSVMEGNDIVDNGFDRGNQRFTTVGATNSYSLLDQYIMGLVGKSDVPNMFVVENPTGTLKRPASSPQIGVSFGGERKEVTIDAIIAANEARQPAVFQAPKVFRQGFILITKKGQSAAPEQIQKVQNIRDAWVSFFNSSTGGRGWVITNLQNSPGTTPTDVYFPYFQGNSQRFTGIAIANWGSTPTDIFFTAYDNNGTRLAVPDNVINPRVVTIAPGAQIALLAEQIHGLSFNDSRNGWIQAQSSSSQISSFFLDGDLEQTLLAGAVAGNQTSKSLYFTRAQLGTGIIQGKTYKNLIDVVNPNNSEAQVALQLTDEFGKAQATTNRTLKPFGRVAEDLSDLFPGIAQPRTKGYVSVTSNVGVIGYQSLDSGSPIFSLPAQPASTATRLYSAQFASGGFGGVQYFTDVNLVNTSAQSRTVQLLLVKNDGAPVGGITNPVTVTLAAGQQYRNRGEAIFGLPDAAVSPAGVEGSLVITSDGPGIIGDVAFGDPVREKFVASLPLESNPVSNLVLSQVAQGAAGGNKPYFTGVAMYNPNAADINVSVEVFSEQGAKTGTASFVLPKGNRISKTLPELVPSIANQVRGYIRIGSTGGPLVAFELFGDQNLDFLAPVPQQPITP